MRIFEGRKLRRRMGLSSVPITGLGHVLRSRLDGNEWRIQLTGHSGIYYNL